MNGFDLPQTAGVLRPLEKSLYRQYTALAQHDDETLGAQDCWYSTPMMIKKYTTTLALIGGARWPRYVRYPDTCLVKLECVALVRLTYWEISNLEKMIFHRVSPQKLVASSYLWGRTNITALLDLWFGLPGLL